jgi:hypothetical protein
VLHANLGTFRNLNGDVSVAEVRQDVCRYLLCSSMHWLWICDGTGSQEDYEPHISEIPSRWFVSGISGDTKGFLVWVLESQPTISDKIVTMDLRLPWSYSKITCQRPTNNHNAKCHHNHHPNRAIPLITTVTTMTNATQGKHSDSQTCTDSISSTSCIPRTIDKQRKNYTFLW